MKISFCSIAFRKSPYNIIDIITIISHVGYDAIEIWGNHFGKIPLREIKDALADNNIAVSMISPYMDFTDSLEKWNESVSVAEAYSQISREIECDKIRVFTGIVGSREASKEQWSRAVKGLKKICAENPGVIFALETHPKTLVDNIESTVKLIEDVGADNLKVNLDIYHMWEVHKDPLDVLNRLYPHVCHIHAKNADLPPKFSVNNHPLLHDKKATQNIIGVTYLKDGRMEYGDFIEKLLHTGFSGYFSVEWFGHHAEKAARHEIDYVDGFLKGNTYTLKLDRSQI